jgi:hypothetical protein
MNLIADGNFEEEEVSADDANNTNIYLNIYNW